MPKFDFNEWGPVTVLLVILTVLVAIVGGLITIIQPETLSFEELLNDLQKFALALGVLGVGRGIKAAGDQRALKADLYDTKG